MRFVEKCQVSLDTFINDGAAPDDFRKLFNASNGPMRNTKNMSVMSVNDRGMFYHIVVPVGKADRKITVYRCDGNIDTAVQSIIDKVSDWMNAGGYERNELRRH